MDVVVFKWSELDDGTRTRIIEHEHWTFGYTFPIDKWFAKCYDATTIIIFSKRTVIDFEMTMSKEKYVEFCLTWM